MAVGWGCRIKPLRLCRLVRPQPTNWYDTEQSDGERPALEFWEMQSIPSLPSLPDLLWTGVVTHDRALSMGQIELFDI